MRPTLSPSTACVASADKPRPARALPSPRSSSSLLYKTIPVVAQQAVIPTGASALTKCVAAVSSTTPVKLAVAKPLLPPPANFLGRAVVM